MQEALTNVVKHAHASTVRLAVDEADETIAIEVRDDGVGFAPGSAVDGFGLAGMRERVRRLADGRLEIDSGAEGTVVRARLPARAAQRQARRIDSASSHAPETSLAG
ncbi:MAG: ATP-binding protein [Solirubrobacteraceae bacterium]